MHEYRATVNWTLGDGEFSLQAFPRDHRWRFGSGGVLDATAAPEYRGNPDLVNPEEAFIASLASCHMLTFLAAAASRKLQVVSYEDNATGEVDRNAEGRIAVIRVVLKPRVLFGGDSQPDTAEIRKIHDAAHKNCFIANSVLTEVVVEPQ